MSIIRIIAAGFLVCLIVMTSCLGLNHPTTSQTAIDKTLSAISQIKSYQLGTDFTDESGFTEWKGTKVIDVSNKEMAMNMTITMGPSSPPITVSDEMYFMAESIIAKLFPKRIHHKLWGGLKAHLSTMSGINKHRYCFLLNY